jgi:hypothetical protein
MRLTPTLTVTLFATMALASCSASAEQTIKDEIVKANHCETVDDCVDAGGKCPFDCYIFVHKDEVSRIRSLVERYQSTCTYSCIAIDGVDCVGNKCVVRQPAPVAESSAAPEGNPGAPCETDDECVTPETYLIRSMCPFTSWCVDGRCSVVCPMMEEEVNAEGYNDVQTCEADSDCDCSRYAAMDGARCTCTDGMCGMIVDNEQQ